MKWLAIVMVAVATCGATAVAQQNPMQPNADAAGTVVNLDAFRRK